jgi:hypothetical protein
MLLFAGDVAQLGERDNRTVEVRGSSPLISIMYYAIKNDEACLSLRIYVFQGKGGRPQKPTQPLYTTLAPTRGVEKIAQN